MTCNDGLVKGNAFFGFVKDEARKKKIPITATFELTPRCNFNCKMCYVHLKEDKIHLHGHELSGDKWIEIAKEAKDAGVLTLCITGGEPILHPEFKRIYEEISKMGFYITLQTNLSTIKGDILKLIKKYPPSEIKFSIYGSNDEVYKEVCGVSGGFTAVDASIKEIKKLNIPLLAVTTLIKQNIHDIGNIHAYCTRMGIPWIYTSSVKPSVRGADKLAKGVPLTEEDMTDIEADIRDMIDRPCKKENLKPCEVCKDQGVSFWMTWDGKMRFCSFMNEPNISIEENSLKEAWNKLLDYEENLRWPDECYSCEIFKICRKCSGMLNAASGSPLKVDKEYCDKLKRYVKAEMDKRNEI